MGNLPKEKKTTMLLTLLEKGELTMTQLQEETGFSTITVLNLVEELMTADLLEERREKELPKRRFVRLSEEGLRCASLLNIITRTTLDTKGLIDLGVKAGRMVGYREAAILLRQQTVTRDYSIAEFLLRDLESLAESLGIVTDSLPPEMSARGVVLEGMKRKVEVRVAEARKLLQKNDIRQSAESVAAAWKEVGADSGEIEKLLKELKERKLDDLSKIVEFIAPRTPQKG